MAQLGAPSSAASGSFMNSLYLFRRVLLGVCSVLNIATLALIGHWLSGSIADDFVFVFEIIGIIAAVLTLVLIPAMLIVSRIRRNAWFVYILTEVVVFGLLWILWTVTAALVIQDFNDLYLGDCSLWLFPASDWCNQLSAIKGLAVTIFVLLLIYVLTLTTFAVVRTFTVGSGVWFQTVQEQTLRAPADSGRAAPTIDGTAPSMWDSEKSANEVHSEGAAASVGGGITGYALQGSPAPSSGVATYPPSSLSQALSMQMGAANSAGPNLNAVGSSVTNLPTGAGAAGGPGAGTAQQYYSGTPQQVNMHVSRSSPPQQAVGSQNVMGNQGAPVTPSYPQL
ncbi:hypothetical protein D9619_013151 [Psilocybe cf. subviscida]|uniref:MARVEL domain-containing protein n=1 Tax=Psilocybe cf. subviscida TaxID=2480587 RepID=A0A8H5EYX2_9AGAR|nr:hypothetical protein D9619_013151 [Psilocybe cf. subviscida]